MIFPMELTHNEAQPVVEAANMGIDSRLEGFTKSTFRWILKTIVPDKWVEQRLQCEVHLSEMQILIRRLLELETEEAESLADSIVYVQYDVEVI